MFMKLYHQPIQAADFGNAVFSLPWQALPTMRFTHTRVY
jgi:hypothetical protein